MKYKRAGVEMVVYYQVLCIFSKNYNKWFVHLEDDKVPFVHGSKKYKILVRMMNHVSANTYTEVKLETDGDWSPKAVYRIAYLADVISVLTKLQTVDDIWDEN